MGYRYQVRIFHPGLGKERILTASDEYILNSRARELKARWDSQYEKQLESERRAEERDQRKQDLQDNLEEARTRTEDAMSDLQSLEALLSTAIRSHKPFDWDSLKNHTSYSPPHPPPPIFKQYPAQPVTASPKIGFLGSLIPALRRSRIAAAQAETEKQMHRWKQEVHSIEGHNKAIESAYVDEIARWESGREKHGVDIGVQNAAIDQQHEAYEAGAEEAVTGLCEIVISRENNPVLPSSEFEIEYQPSSKSLVIEFSLPTPAAIPRVKEVKYVKARNVFTETLLSESERDRLYDSVVYQICLRVISAVFHADRSVKINGISFNGWVTAVDPAKGKETTTCIISVTTRREQFCEIDLNRVDPKACFRALKGVGSSKLHSITAIAPICTISREDHRFIMAHDVAGTLAQGYNLATMDWEEFEQLIREVFAKEFSVNGGEVKVTQASRDGGVDAVAFDPDPIRGGKIVIQAKRYTHTVGVSAVRDLYGTLMNEGANKGILVTTADYGPDAYQFAVGKPLTLLNGANLLHLLEKHGHTARIDLHEARTSVPSIHGINQ
jgi:restriction system protein